LWYGGVLEEVGRREVGWEKVGLEGGGGEVYVACWDCIFYHGMGRTDQEGAVWVLSFWLVSILFVIFILLSLLVFSLTHSDIGIL
jgi:hypothetical protein